MHALKPVQTKYFNSGPTERLIMVLDDVRSRYKNALRLSVTDANDFVANIELF